MKSSDIRVGETYMFVATDSKAREHLVGSEFHVIDIKAVWRHANRGKRKLKRFFNEDGIGARAEELEPINETKTQIENLDELPF